MKLAIYCICKNESKFVDKWFENMKDADYICILDTGSTDDTYKKLQKLQKKYPEKIILKQEKITPWRFDVARNKSLELVPEDADILFCPDFDELFTTPNWVQVIKDNWILGETNRGYYTYVWSHNELGEGQDIFIYDKLHDRYSLKWIFPVHEVLWPVNEHNYTEHKIDLAGKLVIEHYQDKSKNRPYMELLKLAVEEQPDNPHERMLLAREYLLKGDFETSLAEYLKTLEMPAIDLPEYRSVLLESLGRCADLYKVLENYDEAIWYCQEFIKEDYTYREPYFILAELYNAMKMYTLSEACAEAGLKYGIRKYNWIERATTWLGWGYDILSCAQWGLGKYNEALENINEALKHEPNDSRLLKNKIAIMDGLMNKKEE